MTSEQTGNTVVDIVRRQPKSLWVGLAIGLAVGVAAVAVVVQERRGDVSAWGVSETTDFPTVAIGERPPIRSGIAADVIAHFTCPCNRCEMDELADCDCNHPGGATEVKQFIAETVSLNRYSAEEIVAMVDNRYGGKIR